MATRALESACGSPCACLFLPMDSSYVVLTRQAFGSFCFVTDLGFVRTGEHDDTFSASLIKARGTITFKPPATRLAVLNNTTESEVRSPEVWRDSLHHFSVCWSQIIS